MSTIFPTTILESVPQTWVERVQHSIAGRAISRSSFLVIEEYARMITQEIVAVGQFPTNDQFDALLLLRAYRENFTGEPV